jgi:protein-tyrosine phosphatase
MERLHLKDKIENDGKMRQKPNVLVVCGRNKKRSRTAEYIFKNDNRFHLRSAGLSPKSERRISENDLKWANLIFVMEIRQKKRIFEMYRQMELPRVEVLNIADEYEFMNEKLVELLDERINETLKNIYGI